MSVDEHTYYISEKQRDLAIFYMHQTVANTEKDLFALYVQKIKKHVNENSKIAAG